MATIPTAYTFTDGTVPNAAALNAGVRDGINFAANQPSCVLTRGLGLTWHGAGNIITWTGVSYDNDNMSDLVGANDRITVRTKGRYIWSTVVDFTEVAGGNYRKAAIVQLNASNAVVGATGGSQFLVKLVAGQAFCIGAGGLETFCQVGDYFQVRYTDDNATGTNVTSATSNGGTVFCGYRVGSF